MRMTIFTKNNFRFMILHTFHLVRKGFIKWRNNLHILKFLRTQAIKN
jgi:hypothetical protein